MTSKNNQPGDAAPSADTTGSLQADSLRLSSGQALRRQAEAKLSEQKKKAAALPAPETDTQRLIHELEVHQIELEMQNEELVQSRTQVEVGLRQYTDLYDFAPVGYFSLALDGAIHQVNMAGANLLGVEHGALIKRRFGVFVSTRSRTTFSAFLEKVFSTSGSKETCEIALQKDGPAPLWVHIEAMTEDGQCKTCRAVVVDITERKQAEEALRVSEENFHQSLEDSPLGVRIVSEEGETLYVNRATLDIFGYDSIEEWQTTRAVKRYTEQSYAAFKVRREKRCLGEDDSSEYGIDIVRKDGEVRHLQVWRKRVLWNGKEHYQVIYRDITEHKRAETALLDSETLFRKLFEDHAAVKLIIDPDTGNIIDANKAAAVFYGWSREQLKQMKIQEINTLSPEEVKKEMEKARTKKKIHFEFRHRRVDSSVRDVDVFSSKVEVKGKDLLHSIIHDITDRKLAEEQLRKSLEQLRRAMQTTIQVLVLAVEMKDPYTAGHQRRMTNLARTMATEMGLPPEKIEGLRMAGVIHDIGKISLPTEILSKPAKLSAIELSLIREHVRLGYDILKDVECPWPLAEIVLQHHERMDGSGYPRGLKGEEILIEARILAVADVVEAMASHRPYRPALGIDTALAEIEKNRGLLYDSHAVDTCLRVFREKGYQIEGI